MANSSNPDEADTSQLAVSKIKKKEISKLFANSLDPDKAGHLEQCSR